MPARHAGSLDPAASCMHAMRIAAAMQVDADRDVDVGAHADMQG